MESLISRLFLHQWQRKLFALLSAIVIWFFVSQSITSSKTIPSVPIRVVNLPNDMTIPGLLPNGFLTKRTTLNLVGTKDIIDHLEPGDIAVILDVSRLPKDGIVQVTKKDLISLNPNINLQTHVTSVSNTEFVIRLSPASTEKIPITILPPKGEAPNGYEFLDIWPQKLFQTVTGPQDVVQNLKQQGLEIEFNLSDITLEQLDSIYAKDPSHDEINFVIPDAWKKVPGLSSKAEAINDPEAKNLQINFLKPELIPLKEDLPIHLFFPLEFSATINPKTIQVIPSPFNIYKNDILVLTVPLFASKVSKQFLSFVKDHIEINIVCASSTKREYLDWEISLVDVKNLEEAYVAHFMTHLKESGLSHHKMKAKEAYFRDRFRLYSKRLVFLISTAIQLEIVAKITNNALHVEIPHAQILTSSSNTFSYAH